MNPDQWSDAIYDATGLVLTRQQAEAIGQLVERQQATLAAERDRLAAELAKAHRDIIPWIDRVGRLSAELESQQPKSPQPTPRQPRA
jgi:hypothetical protein